jgi:mannose-6-phosphate isomerase
MIPENISGLCYDKSYMSKFTDLEIKTTDKAEAFQQVADYIIKQGYKITNLDIRRPWGFYLYADPSQQSKFIDQFYEGENLEGIDVSLPLMVVQPKMRLSWQYHHRRSEIWRCLAGSYLVIQSQTDDESDPVLINKGDTVTVKQGMRHRCVGTDEWGVFAEIWQHTEPDNPTDEDDIVRLQDDFGR